MAEPAADAVRNRRRVNNWSCFLRMKFGREFPFSVYARTARYTPVHLSSMSNRVFNCQVVISVLLFLCEIQLHAVYAAVHNPEHSVIGLFHGLGAYFSRLPIQPGNSNLAVFGQQHLKFKLLTAPG